MMKRKPTAILLKAEDITEYEQMKEINKIREQAELLNKQEKRKKMERRELSIQERIGCKLANNCEQLFQQAFNDAVDIANDKTLNLDSYNIFLPLFDNSNLPNQNNNTK
ncbi:hypothetical protein H8356DRAFT_1302410 [Neocallimastix lanati (nom. inval.)]|uniref:Uncharacterized protein n=1 Tax=Neocallimastix californiae TaxID=1754190 RepID=A0A1Y2F6Z4_9FUNG|nr:hypothetical protein H8356DRAFT_1302410 [Neocallimastix sp. JGI-2020a]ORY79641.1 hypothetical protein LY90DRAFT_500661 [Neocallimastix californiae]|eukprot:ORY79641.1 hypothetical protein LY90DRAFT_500661 [Neocallimastix californiae]